MEPRKSPFSNYEDRISILPTSLIHHILSFIDMRYAVRTSVLSRRWRHMWTSLPTLNFDSVLFPGYKTEQMVGFVNFVDMVFVLHDNSDLQRFHLISHDGDCDTIKSRLNTWILAALRRNVQEVFVNINVDMIIQLPQCLFNCQTLTKLELDMGGRQRSNIILPESMNLPRLKSLKISSLSIDDGSNTSNLFSSCPVLESLVIAYCYLAIDYPMNIYFPNLKHLELNNCDYLCRFGTSVLVDVNRSIKLDAPNLTSLVLKDYLAEEYSLGNFSSLVTADINMILVENEDDEGPDTYSDLSAEDKELYAERMMKFLRALYNVKDLTLSPGILETVSGAPDLLNSSPLQFCNLRCLKLQTWVSRNCMHTILYLLNISPNIDSLFLRISETEFYSDYWEAELSFPCVLNHLKFVEIRGVLGSVCELKLLESLLKNAVILKKVILFSFKADSPDMIKFREKLQTFPCASSRITIFFFQS